MNNPANVSSSLRAISAEDWRVPAGLVAGRDSIGCRDSMKI